MTEGTNEEVKEFIERVEVTPSEDDELTEKETDTPGDSSEQKEPKGKESEDEDDESEDKGTTPEKEDTKVGTDSDGIKRIQGETPKEYALRLEVHRLRTDRRKERSAELIGKPNGAASKRELSPEKKALIEKYKPEELAALREVIPVLAEEMGLVSEDQMNIKAVVEKSNEVFESFMEAHPEYSEENDPEGTLWAALKEEYGLYAKPNDPKQLRKILDRAHKEVFGIQPAEALKTVKTAQEKVKVASHGGNSKPQVAERKNGTTRIASTGARQDMLKGFSEAEIAEMFGDEE
jgi:hypothetical protein